MFLSGKNQITEIIEETISNIEDSSNSVKLSEMIKDQENQKLNMNAF
jgi:hypothetical protein